MSRRALEIPGHSAKLKLGIACRCPFPISLGDQPFAIWSAHPLALSLIYEPRNLLSGISREPRLTGSSVRANLPEDEQDPNATLSEAKPPPAGRHTNRPVSGLASRLAHERGDLIRQTEHSHQITGPEDRLGRRVEDDVPAAADGDHRHAIPLTNLSFSE